MLFIALTVTLIVRYNGCCSSPRTRYEHKLKYHMPVGKFAQAKVMGPEAHLLASGRPRDPGACRHGALLSQSSVA